MLTQELIDFSNYLADISKEIAVKYFRQDNGEITKGDNSPVTKADREIEKLLRQEITKKFPDHGIIGEEFDNINENADFTWILDPIDGTSSFIVGRPIFGSLIALAYKNKPILGILNQPINNERWIGVDSQYSKFNQQLIKTRNCTKIADAVMCSSSSHYFQGDNQKILQNLCTATKYQKIGGVVYGGDCYSYGCLASGFVDIVIDPGLQIYDYAALVPIIEMAGGVISDWQGNDLNLKSNVNIVASANKELHQEVLGMIKAIN